MDLGRLDVSWKNESAHRKSVNLTQDTTAVLVSLPQTNKMSYYQSGNSNHHCSIQQLGDAAAIRTHVPPGELRTQLNQIVHSADKNPHLHGQNPYADPSLQYDARAQKVIDQAQQHKK
jgi:biopolymer transport protein ExbD